jgi:hypothetical protein
MFVEPAQEEPSEAAATKDQKVKKDKKDKPDRKNTDKAAAADAPTLAPPSEVSDRPAAPAEPLPAEENDAEQHGNGNSNDRGDDHGKGHDKKK